VIKKALGDRVANDIVTIHVFGKWSRWIQHESLGRLDWCRPPPSLFVRLEKVDFSGSMVKSIEERSFVKCNGLKSVKFGKKLTELGDFAFGACSSLVEVVLPEGLKEIREGAFMGCASLKILKFGRELTKLGAYSFNCCKNLIEVVLPDGLGEIGEAVFSDSALLKIVRLGSQLTNLGRFAFADCASLIEIVLPDGVKLALLLLLAVLR
jgi:hypothetical protein